MRHAASLAIAAVLAGWTCTSVAAQAVTGSAAPAQPPEERVTMQQVLDLVDASPRLHAEQATVAVAAAERVTARTHPNPSLSYGGVHLLGGESTGAIDQQQVVVEQPLLLHGIRRSRSDVADRGVAAEEARVADARATLRREARVRFIALVARQDDLQLLADSRRELQRIEDIVRGRAAAGDRSQYDVVRIESEGRRLDVDLQDAEADVDDAAGQLAALVGRPGWRPRADGTLDGGQVPDDPAVLWAQAQERLPALVTARRREAAAEAAVALARLEAKPSPSLNAGALLTHAVSGSSVVFGLSIPLPFFDRNQGPIARAAAELSAERAATRAALAEAQAELQRAHAIWTSRRRALATADGEVASRVPQLRRMAEDSYREGRSSVLELLDASRTWREIAELRIHQRELARLAEADVVAAAGLDAPAP